MTDKLDIFDVLQRVDNFDLEYFKSLDPEQKKTLAPYVLLQWMSGCKSKEQVLRVNTFLNYSVFNLGKHPDLLFKLALISSDGKKKKYTYVKKKGRSKKYATAVDLLKRHFQCSTRQALDYIPLLGYDGIEEIAHDMGVQDTTLKKIKKEIG